MCLLAYGFVCIVVCWVEVSFFVGGLAVCLFVLRRVLFVVRSIGFCLWGCFVVWSVLCVVVCVGVVSFLPHGCGCVGWGVFFWFVEGSVCSWVVWLSLVLGDLLVLSLFFLRFCGVGLFWAVCLVEVFLVVFFVGGLVCLGFVLGSSVYVWFLSVVSGFGLVFCCVFVFLCGVCWFGLLSGVRPFGAWGSFCLSPVWIVGVVRCVFLFFVYGS